ncbi:hypothetical protein PHYSODRAFT_325772 [Phytophthora sojae]|uniref:Uncharacterized protein n=1 Tax=Phytophthora sojae (strain P6497) TaxID=1094619 RepID=G4Z0C6_PHYSP|nr:hypothetical protein PHYSODRAFT_325772 [Phytophthora sojae]EGZ24683.1 hypothetical protein PHYSODRAFT_325772 [Phytophthora sojae]|eukprot:XP_009519971.1 hypothetical protein PHYSODRAFT_325772 [Phytophthora sojae]
MTQSLKPNSSLGLERFSGNKQEFTMWEDKVRTHIDDLGQAVLMATFLDGRPEKPVVLSGDDATAEVVHDGRWELAHWNRARTAIQNLFNQSLPNGFLSTLPDTVSMMDPCEWGRVLASNSKDVGSLFARLKKLRNEINWKTKVLVGQGMVNEAWLYIEVLSQLPSELWASSVSMTNAIFTVANVEMRLRRVIGDKPRQEVVPYIEKKKATRICSVKGTDAIIEHNASGSRTQVAAGSSGSSATSDIASRVSDAMEVAVALEDAVRGVSADMDTATDAMRRVCAGNIMTTEALGVTVVVLGVVVCASTGTEVGKNVTGDQTACANASTVRKETVVEVPESDAMVAGDSGSAGSGRGSAVSSMTSDVVVANVAVLDVV